MKKNKKIKKYRFCVLQLIGIVLLLFGGAVYFYPDFGDFQMRREAERQDKKWAALQETVKNSNRTAEEKKEIEKQEKIKEKMKRYNQELLTNEQKLVDVFSYEETPVQLGLREDEPIGTIQIPDMKVKLPLYAGASQKNLAKGAAVLSETSMPIGGVGTNCVIAGHRGYQGMAYFREIEKLQLGSLVSIKNPWERLDYRVKKIKIIEPQEISKILIRPKKDMVTLITCHPYMSHGKQRYVVYCERNHDMDMAEKKGDSQNAGKDIEKYVPQNASQKWIDREKILHFGLPVLVFMLILLFVCFRKIRSHRRKNLSADEGEIS